MPIDFPNGSVVYTLSYILEDAAGGLHVVDPGSDSDDNLLRLRGFLRSIGHDLSAVRSAIVTHMHADHLGLAHRLRDVGATLMMHEAEEESLRRSASFPDPPTLADWGVPPARRGELQDSMGRHSVDAIAAATDVILRDGETLPIPGRRVRVVSTPGHTPGHICLADVDDRLIFTGDHVLPMINPGVGIGIDRGRNLLREYLQSLERTAGFDDFDVCPGHGFRFVGLRQRSDEIRSHHVRRTTQIRTLMLEHPGSSVWEIAQRVTWTAGWTQLHGPRLASALAQTEMHIDCAH